MHALALPLLLLLGFLVSACGGGGSVDRGGTTVVTVPDTGPGPGTPVDPPTQSKLRRTAGSLSRGRYGHTATLLTGGQVLIVGGTSAGTSTLSVAELYAPGADLFTPTASLMTLARTNHTATRLADGRVLIAGGWNEFASGQLIAVSHAEIYDPIAQTFTAVVDRMVRARADHAATLLPDGRVLITGGSERQGAVLVDFRDAEIFDPATAQFEPLPNQMAHTHATHAVLDVGFGRYLVAGGSFNDLSCEVFDLTTSAFTAFAVPAGDGVRFNVAAATFNGGGAVVAGGSGTKAVLYARPGAPGIANSGSPLGVGRALATATRIADRAILVVGGIDFQLNAIQAGCDLIVETGNQASSATYGTSLRFPTGMAAHSATRLLDGRVLYVGGLGTDAAQSGLTAAYLYTP
jgi:hypothetical protein